MNEIFLVSWTGGYAPPQYAAFKTEDEARSCYEKWEADSKVDSQFNDGGDWLDLIRIDLTTLEIEGVGNA